MTTLKLTLKRGWFDMIASGQKEEEYREIKPYWIKRLIDFKSEMEFDVFDEFCNDLKNPLQGHNTLRELLDFFDCDFKKFDAVEFTNGYSSKDPKITMAVIKTTIGVGLYVWGAPSYPVFQIQLGDEISRKNC